MGLSGYRIELEMMMLDCIYYCCIYSVLLNLSFANETKPPKVPRVFIGGRYIGGAEEVKQLHEIGELKKLVQELPRIEPGVCEMCGGHRFVPCNACHGSHKVHTEKLGFRTCSVCNQNGLVRCSCSFPHLFA
jgi:glutaredoxin domain-containing cysteine-rich protein 1